MPGRITAVSRTAPRAWIRRVWSSRSGSPLRSNRKIRSLKSAARRSSWLRSRAAQALSRCSGTAKTTRRRSCHWWIYYDTEPLKATLEKLVDFDLINEQRVRLSLGAVNVRTGNSIYFDNTKIPIRPEHIMASGALPPGFPPVEIEGELYWDGGIVSNTPLWYVLDEDFRMDALIFQVDVFSAAAEAPLNLSQVQERAKDIQYSSKTRFNTSHLQEIEGLRASLRRVLEKMPKSFLSDPDVRRLSAASTRGPVTIVHFINRHNTRSLDFKDYEFSRATVTDLWEGGHNDVRRAIANPDWHRVNDPAEGIRIFDFTGVKDAPGNQ